jgi:hypothetical protein
MHPGLVPFRQSRLATPAAPTARARPRAPVSAGSSATSTAATALRLRARFIHYEVAITEEPTVQHLDGLLSFFLRGHFHEAEAARPPGELVGDDADRLDVPRLSEELAEVLFRGLK